MASGKNKAKKYIVGLTSGLGNQLFQYLLYTYLKDRGEACSLCTVKKHLNEHNGLEISNIFPKVNEDIDKNRIDQLYVSLHSYFEWPLGIIRYKIPQLYRFLSRFNPYKIVIFPAWETYTFINEVANIDRILPFPELDIRNKKIKEGMHSQNAVSIHVRRGDFQKVVKWRLVLGDVCDKQYYQTAIERVSKCLTNPRFYVFSDDILWAKENLNLPADTLFVDWNKGHDSYKDIQLMTYCKCNICANSTFSLIAAWLNLDNDAIKIVPSKWSNQFDDDLFERYIPKGDDKWVVIENNKPQISIVYDGVIGEQEEKRIVSQSYTDYEVICKYRKTPYQDKRFVEDIKPNGRYVYKVVDFERFKDHKHLRDWLIQKYLDE